jgi:1,2-diacylglycerol 3-beta-galactosyltransferase
MTAALAQLRGDALECSTLDILQLTEVPIMRDAPALYDQLSTRWLPLYDASFTLTNGHARIGLLLELVYLQAHRRLMEQLTREQPALVVVVHPLAVQLVAAVREAYRLPFRIATVVTDLVSLHASWGYSKVDRCIVPTHEAYRLMRSWKVPEERLALSGFPVHPKFTQQGLDKQAARQALGLAQGHFTLLITSGGVGAGRVAALVALLRAQFPQLQLIVVTGRNAQLRQELIAANYGPLVQVEGYVDNMEQLMAASDVVVTKAGPGTLMEALVMRRPVLVTEAVGRQEEGNIDFVLNHELGAYCPTDERLVVALHELQHEADYAAAVARLDHAVPRDGAWQTAQLLLNELDAAPIRHDMGGSSVRRWSSRRTLRRWQELYSGR